MRAFIAVDMPGDVKKYLHSLQDALHCGGLSLARDFHITLKFLGEISEQQSHDVANRLSVLNIDKFSASLSGLGFFPNDRHIRVVWVGAEPKGLFSALHNEIESLLKGMFGHDDFVPHITLARVRMMDSRERFLEAARSLSIEPKEFPVDSVKLKKSTLTPNGPVYEDLAVFNLQ